MMSNQTSVRRLTASAMLAALAYACVAISSVLIPIKIEGFLSVEFKDAILLIGAVLFGPLTGLIMTAVVAFLEFLTFSGTGWIGLVMNIVASGLFIVPASCIYRRKRTLGRLIAGLICGTLTVSAGMILWNYALTPLYMGVDRAMVVGMLIPIILPFNLLKAALNGGLAVWLLRALSPLFVRMGLRSDAENATGKSIAWIALAVSVGLLAVGLIWSGIL